MAEEVHCVHILVKTQKDANHLRDRVLAGEDFGALAREYSSCPSREQGGDLGWFGRGQMVKPFEDFCFQYNSGDFGIVQTQFGWHVIYIIAQR